MADDSLHLRDALLHQLTRIAGERDEPVELLIERAVTEYYDLLSWPWIDGVALDRELPKALERKAMNVHASDLGLLRLLPADVLDARVTDIEISADDGRNGALSPDEHSPMSRSIIVSLTFCGYSEFTREVIAHFQIDRDETKIHQRLRVDRFEEIRVCPR